MFRGRQIHLDALIAQAKVFCEQKGRFGAAHTSWALRIVTFTAHLLGFAYVALLCTDLPQVWLPSSQITFSTLFLPALAFGVLLVRLTNTWLHVHMQALAALCVSERLQILFWRNYYELDRAKIYIRAFIDAINLPKLPTLPIMAQFQAWVDGLIDEANSAVPLFVSPLSLNVCERISTAASFFLNFTRTPRAVHLLC